MAYPQFGAAVPGVPLTYSKPAVPTPTVVKPQPTQPIVKPPAPAQVQAIQSPASTAQTNINAIQSGSAVDSGGNAITGFGNIPQVSTQPPVPSTTTNPTTPTPSTPNSDYAATLQSLRQKYLDTFTPTPEIKQTQSDIANLEGSAQLGQQAIANKPIPLAFVRGLQAKQQAQANTQDQTLQAKLANLLTNRQLDQKQAQAALGFQTPAPTEVSVGSNLVRLNPQTGQYETVAQGQSYTAKQGQQAVFDLFKQSPDAGIDPINDNYATASAKVAASQSFANKSSAVQTIANPLTGAISVIPTKPYNAANAASVQSQAQSGFTLGSDGKTVAYNGTPIDLTTYKQLTGQTNVPDNQVDFSAVKKPATSSGARSGGGTISTNPNDVYNLDLAKGLAGAATTLIGQGAQQASSLNALTLNASSLLQLAQQNNINPSQYPDLNSLANAFSKKGLGDVSAGTLAAYKNSIKTLQGEYANILAAKGGLTPSEISSNVNDVVPNNLSPAEFNKVVERIKAEGANSITGIQQSLGTIGNTIQNIPFNSGQAAQAPNFLPSNSSSTPASLFNGLF